MKIIITSCKKSVLQKKRIETFLPFLAGFIEYKTLHHKVPSFALTSSKIWFRWNVFHKSIQSAFFKSWKLTVWSASRSEKRVLWDRCLEPPLHKVVYNIMKSKSVKWDRICDGFLQNHVLRFFAHPKDTKFH